MSILFNIVPLIYISHITLWLTWSMNYIKILQKVNHHKKQIPILLRQLHTYNLFYYFSILSWTSTQEFFGLPRRGLHFSSHMIAVILSLFTLFNSLTISVLVYFLFTSFPIFLLFVTPLFFFLVTQVVNVVYCNINFIIVYDFVTVM